MERTDELKQLKCITLTLREGDTGNIRHINFGLTDKIPQADGTFDTIEEITTSEQNKMLRTEEEIRARLDYLQDRELNPVTPYDGEDYQSMKAEMYSLLWVLKEGDVEVELPQEIADWIAEKENKQ